MTGRLKTGTCFRTCIVNICPVSRVISKKARHFRYNFILNFFPFAMQSSVTFQEGNIGDLNVEEGPVSRAVQIGDTVPLTRTVDVCARRGFLPLPLL